jgi:hypothetical protein
MTTTLPTRPFAWFELEQLDLTRHDLRQLLAAHRVRRLLRGVYAASDLEDTITLRATAASLVLKDHMVLSDRTAAWVHGVDHYRPYELSEPPALDVVTVGGRHTTRRRGTFGGQRDLLPEEICEVQGVRVTTPARTGADLACLFGRREAISALDALMRTCAVTRPDLDALMPRFKGRRGVTQLRELIPLATPLAESPGESWARIDIHDAGLPAPRPQFGVLVNGVEKFRLDLAYPAWKVVVEYDGEAHHSSAADRAHDEARRAWLRRHGWIVIVVTKEDFRTYAQASWLLELQTALELRMPTRLRRRYAAAERPFRRRR